MSPVGPQRGRNGDGSQDPGDEEPLKEPLPTGALNRPTEVLDDPTMLYNREEENQILARKHESFRTDQQRSLAGSVRDRKVFDAEDQTIKDELIHIIVQYLQDEGFYNASMVVQDEANVRIKNTSAKRSQLRRIKRAILAGEWAEVEEILTQKATLFRYQNHFLYALYKQQYLEMIESHQYQKALFLLSNRMKPLERYASTTSEFRDLSYLLTCRSVSECAAFGDWDGVTASRSALFDQCARLLDFETYLAGTSASVPAVHGRRINKDSGGDAFDIPPGRLRRLVEQALAFQIESSKYRLRAPPRIGTILEDFECTVVPNKKKMVLTGNKQSLKCVTFVGDEALAIAAGSSDSNVRVWSTSSGTALGLLTGHRARVWDVAAVQSGALLATGGADGVVHLWNSGTLVEAAVQAGNETSDPSACDAGDLTDTPVVAPRAALGSHLDDDVYAVGFHPDGRYLLAAGYDKVVRMYDVETQVLLLSFSGHDGAVSSIAFNGNGSIAVTGSKDATVRYWDVLSGLCINRISSHLGEVASVSTNAAGTRMLTCSKDNSNRLWDMRQCKPIRRYKGHQNTRRSFVRAAFGPKERVIIGGSEDGFVYLWDADTEDVVQKLGPAQGPVYSAEWNASRGLLVSCGHDGFATTWCYDPA